MPILRRLSWGAAVLLLALAACTSPSTGSVQFFTSAPQALSASDVTRVKLTISASDMPSLVVEVARSNGAWGGIIGNVPAGSNRAFLAEAFDSSGTKRFQGQASGVTITANQTTTVALTLQELVPPPAYGNEAPIIDSVVASTTTVQIGGSLSLSTTTRDPNTGDILTFAWRATSGTFSTSTAANTSWTAPSSVGIHTLTFTVTDSQGAAASVSLAVNVVASASTGSAALNIAFNLWPVVSRVSASINRLDVGQSTAVSANATDADGDALSYQWATNCSGTWTNATSSAASFVPSAIPSGACNNCRLTVTVQDGRGGQTTGSINLCVAASSTERFAPTITNAYQSATTTSPGQTATIDVTAMDSQASTLTFTWNASIGSLAAAQNTASTSRVVWTAPSCAVTGVPAAITAVVTNAYGVSASRSFSLSGLPACAAGWTTASPMATTRQYHTTTLLPSGKVLVTGGNSGSGYLASAEVYDPATNAWSSANSMATLRQNHTATLLSSGKVLVAGGTNSSGIIASAEMYDPATNTWSSAGTMASARGNHTAVLLLPSGKVLVSGGGSSLAELYDPATNAWSSAGMVTPRYYATATFLSSSGKVLVTGGYSGSQLNSADLYAPATNTWASANSMTTLRQDHTATLLSSGKVLITGGYDSWYNDEEDYGTNYHATAQLYDPAANSWSSANSMASARGNHTATLLPSGKVLVTGGHNWGNLNSAEVYDPATNAWASVGAMASARYFHTATALPSGRVLVVGGFNGASSLNTTAIYTP